MGIRAVTGRLEGAVHQRLQDLGLDLVETPDDALTPLGAIAAAAAHDVVMCVAGDVSERQEWRRSGPEILVAATAAAADITRPMCVVMIPAVTEPRPGPVVIVSPAGSVSSYEVYLGASFGAVSGRRVEHLNGRGTPGSAVHSAIAGRAVARAAVADWVERATADPRTGTDGVATVAPVGVAPAGDVPAIRASDVVHVRLTEHALELTNRTRQHLRVRIGLGAVDDTDRLRAVYEAAVEPGATTTESLDGVAGMADLAAPQAVLRHWSHGDAEVYEGGERRIAHVGIDILDGSGRTAASRTYAAPNGLDFSVTARDLMALLGSAPAPALPEPAPVRRVRRASVDLLGALESALDVGATALARRRR